ncbi:hypothetical protein C8Q77DRAFT_1233130 [Trametes polyzona]|nr:hypothetical protein C8Q77DRAFT_1233130 [Trametes polyzona]
MSIPFEYSDADLETDDIDFYPDLPDDWPLCGMTFFWLGWKDWLAARGFTLTLEPGRGDIALEWIVPRSTAESQSLPYAQRFPGELKPQEPIQDALPGGKIGYAQDRFHRDIVIKITPYGSEEHCAYQRLLDCTWGDVGNMDEFKTVAQGIQFMRCLLQDIIDANMLVSCYEPDAVYNYEAAQKTLNHYRSVTDPWDVHYCLFDFDICHIFPLDAPLQSCRRPANEAWDGAPSYHPDDVWRAEHDYDPFAYDVACLGYFLVEWFGMQSMVSVIPLLAPLFDKMNTHIAANRFTASEAAQFLEDVVAQTPQSVLDAPMTMEQQGARAGDPDLYWSETPPEFRAQWSSFRMPPRSWFKRALLRFAATEYGWPVLRYPVTGAPSRRVSMPSGMRCDLCSTVHLWKTVCPQDIRAKLETAWKVDGATMREVAAFLDEI